MNKSFILVILALFCAMSFAERTSFRMPRNVIALDEVQDNEMPQQINPLRKILFDAQGVNWGAMRPTFGMEGGSTGRGIGGTFHGGLTGPLNNHGATWNFGGHVTHNPGARPGWGVGGGIRIPF